MTDSKKAFELSILNYLIREKSIFMRLITQLPSSAIAGVELENMSLGTVLTVFVDTVHKSINLLLKLRACS